MKINIVGYGKLGSEVEAAAIARNINIDTIIDPKFKTDAHIKSNAIMAFNLFSVSLMPGVKTLISIDATEPKTAFKNIEHYCDNKMPCVMCTTGEWRNSMEQVDKMARDAGIGIVHQTNFSTKVHIVMLANMLISAMLNDLSGFDIGMVEGHHPYKKDASGTGGVMCEDIIKAGYFGKVKYLTKLNDDRGLDPDEMMMATQRLAGIVGHHEITWTDDARDGSTHNDTIKLSHTAMNRSGFANGALDAALYLAKTKAVGLIDYRTVVMKRFEPLIMQALCHMK